MQSGTVHTVFSLCSMPAVSSTLYLLYLPLYVCLHAMYLLSLDTQTHTPTKNMEGKSYLSENFRNLFNNIMGVIRTWFVFPWECSNRHAPVSMLTCISAHQ